jgi:AcrR family transcriptional regulator
LPHDTREKILQAAFDVLAREGYENTSIKAIAEQARVAQGLVHYHFKSKEQLVLAVLAYVCEKVEVKVEGEAGALAALQATKEKLHDSQSANGLLVQLIGVSLFDAQLQEGVRQFVREQRGNVEAIARQVFAEREQDASPSRGIAGAVWGAVLGIIVQRLIDPEFDADGAIDALGTMALSAVYSPDQRA